MSPRRIFDGITPRSAGQAWINRILIYLVNPVILSNKAVLLQGEKGGSKNV